MWERSRRLGLIGLTLVAYGLGCGSAPVGYGPVRRPGSIADAHSSYEEVASLLNDCGALGNGYIDHTVPGEAVEWQGCAMGARCDLPHSGQPLHVTGNGYAAFSCSDLSCTCSIALDTPDLRVEREVELDGKCTDDQQMENVMREQCYVHFYSQSKNADRR